MPPKHFDVICKILSLGNWDTSKAVKLDPSNSPSWTGTVSGFTANSNVQWKCIKRDSGAVVWQGGSNNSQW